MECKYQWQECFKNPYPKKKIFNWYPKVGAIVLSRKNKIASTVRFSVLIDNPNTQVILACKFNNWGTKNPEKYTFSHDKHSIYATLETDKIKHGDEYKLLVAQNNDIYKYLQDPAGSYFADNGNTIFWDYQDPSCYKPKNKLIDTRNRSHRILQTDLPGLIVHWANKEGLCGRDIPQKTYFNFIIESGIIKHIKHLGFNTIQFLPFAQSIDGDNWKYRYLVPFQFAIQKNWGTPDDFAKMMDAFHKEEIAIIGDFVLSHIPYKSFTIFGQSSKHAGIHLWKNRHGKKLFMNEETSWGTMRPDHENPYVRDFFISSCVHFMKQYKIDGFRIDNVDGILREGENGEGEERQNGRTFLRELTTKIYEYNPLALIHFESHYFYEDNAKMLVAPTKTNSRALGATAYNSSRLTHFLHRDFMIKDAKKITPWRVREITEEKEWGCSNSTIADFHNHDAAAGLMPERCTGSYAYDAMMHERPHNHIHALGKIKVMESIISFCGEGRTLNLAQTFLLQRGTFEHDTSIQWYLTYNEANKNTLAYKQKINKLMEDPAFWPLYSENRKFLNIDDTNKIITVERSSNYQRNNSLYIIVINLSSWTHWDYRIGVREKGTYKIVLNSDLYEYAGLGLISYPHELHSKPSTQFELLDQEILLSCVAPYGVVVLEKYSSAT